MSKCLRKAFANIWISTFASQLYTSVASSIYFLEYLPPSPTGGCCRGGLACITPLQLWQQQQHNDITSDKQLARTRAPSSALRAQTRMCPVMCNVFRCNALLVHTPDAELRNRTGCIQLRQFLSSVCFSIPTHGTRALRTRARCLRSSTYTYVYHVTGHN